jgi:hypothetical protein
VNLTEHFTLEELVASQNAARLGIDNTPGDDVKNNLANLAIMLERLRLLLNAPITVTSGYRSPALNAATKGSAKNSAHTKGLAADIIVPRFGNPLQVAHAISESTLMIDIDQLIHEFDSWVHVAIPDPWSTTAKQQVLTIDHDGTRLGLLSLV